MKKLIQNIIRKMNMLFLSTIVISIIFCCPAFATDKEPSVKTGPGSDYSDKTYWISLPEEQDKAFDVFFMHPTTYFGEEDGMNASLGNINVNKLSAGAVQRQGSVFKKSCNLFAPHYRQASIKVLSLDSTERDKFLSVGVEDMLEALRYYLDNYNNGRPFILAGHSQGSNITLKFLHKYGSLIDKKKLIAVYVIGWTVTDEDIEQLGIPLAVSPEQTGAIITWNTVGKEGKSPVLLPGARCVNPLNWSDAGEMQPEILNKYAKITLKDNSVIKIPHFTSAQIDDRGGLVIPVPSIIDQLSMDMGQEVYHEYDYDFFYGNLVDNVALRCQAWQDNQPVAPEK